MGKFSKLGLLQSESRDEQEGWKTTINGFIRGAIFICVCVFFTLCFDFSLLLNTSAHGAKTQMASLNLFFLLEKRHNSGAVSAEGEAAAAPTVVPSKRQYTSSSTVR